MNLQTTLHTVTLVSLLPLVLTACTGGTRSCPGFGLALADSWSTQTNKGESAVYTGLSGTQATLTLSSRVDSQPYEGFDRFGNEGVICNMTSERLYVVEDSNIAFNIIMRQSQPLASGENQLLSISLEPETPIGTELNYGYLISVADPVSIYNTELINESPSATQPVSTRYILNYSNSQKSYPLAVEQRYDFLEQIPTTSPNASISRVVFAQDGGLVQFEQLDGEIFTRIDSRL